MSETRTLVSILEDVERCPGMFCMRATERDAVSFLMGLDAAHGFGWHRELAAWLLVEFGLPQSHGNLAWPSLIARRACPDRWDRPAERTPADDVAIFSEMFRVVRDFLSSTGRDQAVEDLAGTRAPEV